MEFRREAGEEVGEGVREGVEDVVGGVADGADAFWELCSRNSLCWTGLGCSF